MWQKGSVKDMLDIQQSDSARYRACPHDTARYHTVPHYADTCLSAERIRKCPQMS